MTEERISSGVRHWAEVHRAGERGVSWFAPRPVAALRLIESMRMGPARSVVDVGAGAARLVDALLDRGHTDLTALDVVDEGLAIARGRLGDRAQGVNWIVTDVLDWQPDRPYHLWHDRAVFHFLTTSEDRSRYRDVLDRAVHGDGVVVIGTFAEDGPDTCSGLPAARYTPEELHEALGGHRQWTLHDVLRERHTTPWGSAQPFTWLLLSRAGSRTRRDLLDEVRPTPHERWLPPASAARPRIASSGCDTTSAADRPTS